VSLLLEIEDVDGDLIGVETEMGSDFITLTLSCDELADDTDYEAIYAELDVAEAKRLALNLLMAVGYLEASLDSP